MNLFQLITLPLVGLLFLYSVFRVLRGNQPHRLAVLSAVIWLLTGAAILRPDWTIRVARFFGIGRGADLILYLFVIFFIVACLYFYDKASKLESAISELVRRIAIHDALSSQPQGVPNNKSEGQRTGEVRVSSTEAKGR